MSRVAKQVENVLIIGAGLSGLSCAYALQALGLNTTLLESRDEVGGRMGHAQPGPCQGDYGAQYFTARSPEFKAEVARWCALGVAGLWRPRLMIADAHGLQTPKSETLAVDRYVGLPSMHAPAQRLAMSLTVRTGAKVTKLFRGVRGWEVYTREGGWVEQVFEMLVLAMPAEMCKPLLRSCSTSLYEAVAAYEMRPTWALMLRFRDDFDPGFDAAFVNDGPIRWLAKDSSKPGRVAGNIWVLHAHAQWSAAHAEATNVQVRERLALAFKEMFGVMPITSAAYFWRCAEAKSAARSTYIWDANLAIGVCGDWLSGGKIEGAWMSGRGLARAMIEGSNAAIVDAAFVELVFASPEYERALVLREQVLRVPLGRTLDARDVGGEAQQWHFALCRAQGEILATLSVRIIDTHRCQLRQMAVLGSAQRMGLGTRLLTQVERHLRDKGLRNVQLNARVTACKFYESMAYVAVGGEFEEVGIAHIKMRKKLFS